MTHRSSRSLWAVMVATLLGCGAAAIGDDETAAIRGKTTASASNDDQADVGRPPAQGAPVRKSEALMSFSIADEQFAVPVQIRLKSDPNGRITLSAGNPSGPRLVSLRAELTNTNPRFSGARAEFKPVIGQRTSLAIVEGTLPDIKALWAVEGSVSIATLSKDRAELSFDATLSSRPDGSSERVISKGTIAGPIAISCSRFSEPNENANIEAQEGQGTVFITALDDEQSTPACRALLERLDG